MAAPLIFPAVTPSASSCLVCTMLMPLFVCMCFHFSVCVCARAGGCVDMKASPGQLPHTSIHTGVLFSSVWSKRRATIPR